VHGREPGWFQAKGKSNDDRLAEAVDEFRESMRKEIALEKLYRRAAGGPAAHGRSTRNTAARCLSLDARRAVGGRPCGSMRAYNETTRLQDEVHRLEDRIRRDRRLAVLLAMYRLERFPYRHDRLVALSD
jgi:hypothetical protein